jgi:prepilin peptidase CpaA
MVTMPAPLMASFSLIILLGTFVCYSDVRFRRIPNKYVLTGFFCGLAINTWFGGWLGLGRSLAGCISAFVLMLLLRWFSRATGPGDVKWFAAIGTIIGWPLVLKAFFSVLLTGALLAIVTKIRAGEFRSLCERVVLILYGFLPGNTIPRFPVPANTKEALPYGVAICLGSLIALMWQLPQLRA